MTTEHDEALVKRVTRAMMDERGLDATQIALMGENSRQSWMNKARAVIYPPAPPKTRLQVARELFADAGAYGPLLDDGFAARAILAALALPAMED